MIIFVGGFLGSGKSKLAQALAQHLAFHLVSSKSAYGFETIRAAHREHHGKRSPLDDGEMSMLYNDIANQFPLLLKMHGGIVVCESLHRKEPRDILFNAARKLGETRVIWVESTDEKADKHMRNMQKEMGKSFAGLAAKRAVMWHSVQPFDSPPTVFQNDGPGKDAVQQFLDFYTRLFS